MNEIKKTFQDKNSDKDSLLIPYISAGDPDLETTKKILFELDKNGADIIELGIPFSDPLADGPVIQKAGQRALEGGVSLKKIINMAGEVAAEITSPLLLMGYYNNILKYGKERFINDIDSAGIKGVIIPDLPYEEDTTFYLQLKEKNLAGILLAAPNTSAQRLKYLGQKSTGFLYCVSLLGVTGDKKGPYSQLEKYIKLVRQQTNIPLGLGFGIDGPEKARRVSKFVDGIIIGSAFINIIASHQQQPQQMLKQVASFTKSISRVL